MNIGDIKNFEEFYHPIYILDSSAWLNIYQNLPEGIDFILKLLQNIKNEIYIPYWVSLEFDNNYRRANGDHHNLVKSTQNDLNEIIKTFSSTFSNAIDQKKRLYDTKATGLEKAFLLAKGILQKEIEKFIEPKKIQAKIGEELLISEKVKVFFDELRCCNILPSYGVEEILKINIEGIERYKRKIPPGYMDEKQKKGLFQFGDLYIWKELLSFSKIHNKSIIFIIDDLKEDWFENLCFHSKLVNEFEKETNCKILGIKSKELFSYLENKFPTPHTILIDELVDANLDKIEKQNNDKIFDFLSNKLTYNPDSIFDPYAVLSYYDGTNYQFEDITDFDNISIDFERDNGKLIILIKYNIEFLVHSNSYIGRDDDTKEIIMSETRSHIINGLIEMQLVKSISDFYLNKFDDYDIDVRFCSLKEINYNNSYSDDDDY